MSASSSIISKVTKSRIYEFWSSSTHVFIIVFCIFVWIEFDHFFLSSLICIFFFTKMNNQKRQKKERKRVKLKTFFVLISAWSITFTFFWLAMNECPRIPVKNSRSTFFYFIFLNLNNALSFFFQLAREWPQNS